MLTGTAQTVREHLERIKLVTIFRGDFASYWPDLGAALVNAGIEAIEITLDSADAPGAIRHLSERYRTQAVIGAGTVLTPEQVDQAVEAGARFVVAPNTNPQVIERCRERDVLSIPGAFTATEIEYAYRIGAGMVKVFPSMPIGPAYLKNIRGPFPTIPIIVTGGIGIDQITDFLDAGANAVGLMTSALVSADTFQPGGLDRLRERAARAVSLVDDWRQRHRS